MKWSLKRNRSLWYGNLLLSRCYIFLCSRDHPRLFRNTIDLNFWKGQFCECQIQSEPNTSWISKTRTQKKYYIYIYIAFLLFWCGWKRFWLNAFSDKSQGVCHLRQLVFSCSTEATARNSGCQHLKLLSQYCRLYLRGSCSYNSLTVYSSSRQEMSKINLDDYLVEGSIVKPMWNLSTHIWNL